MSKILALLKKIKGINKNENEDIQMIINKHYKNKNEFDKNLYYNSTKQPKDIL